MENKVSWLKKLAKTRMSGGVLIINEQHEILVLKTSYKKHWEIPGGVFEEYEGPAEAVIREAKEEIGLDVELDRLLVIDHCPRPDGKYIDDNYQLLFLGKKLSLKQIENIQIDNDEIIDYKFVTLPEAIKLLGDNIGPRVSKVNLDKKEVIILECGERVL